MRQPPHRLPAVVHDDLRRADAPDPGPVPRPRPPGGSRRRLAARHGGPHLRWVRAARCLGAASRQLCGRADYPKKISRPTSARPDVARLPAALPISRTRRWPMRCIREGSRVGRSISSRRVAASWRITSPEAAGAHRRVGVRRPVPADDRSPGREHRLETGWTRSYALRTRQLRGEAGCMITVEARYRKIVHG
jgi:hypothetical protein